MKIIALVFAGFAACLNIMITSEHSLASAHTRTLFELLSNNTQDKVILVSPKTDQRESGSRIELGNNPLAISPDHDNKDMWVVDGTTVGSVVAGLDHIVPVYYNDLSIDLVIAGPRSGSSAGPMEQSSSGVVAAMKLCALRGIPSISVSVNDERRVDISEDADSSMIYAQKIHLLVEKLKSYTRKHNTYGTHASFKTSRSRYVNQYNRKHREVDQDHDSSDESNNTPRLLPLGMGLNVNFPLVGEASRTGCVDPVFKQTSTVGDNYFTPTIDHDADSKEFRIGYVHDQFEGRDSEKKRYPSEVTVIDSCTVAVTPISAEGGDGDVDIGDILQMNAMSDGLAQRGDEYMTRFGLTLAQISRMQKQEK